MLTCQAFFARLPEEHNALFPPAELVWQPLKNLKAYLLDYHFQAVPRLLTCGEPLTSAAVLHEGRLLSGQDVLIEYGEATKGKLVVRKGSQILEGATVVMAGAVLMGGQIQLGKGVLVESGAFIKGPTILGDRTEVRQGAYIRGHCLAGRRCVIGHTTEVKHSIFLDDAKAGHFAYLGDSILGNRVNLGAGTKLANLRFLGDEVIIKTPDGPVSSGLKKLGAIMADDVQTGCNSVTNPGTLLGQRSVLLPNSTAPSGYHRPASIVGRDG